MESVYLQMPEDEKYFLCLLDSNGKPSRIIVFNGNSVPMSDDDIIKHIFSKDEERLLFDMVQPKPAFINSIQQIHKDDSIRTIKKKVVQELGINEVCYDELYMFSKRYQSIQLLKTYNELTKFESVKLSKSILGQFLLNLQADISNVEEINSSEKDNFTFDDFVKYIGDINNSYNVSLSIGQQFASYNDLLFSANPYDILAGNNKPIFELVKDNGLYVFENHLLLNYGELINNTLYLCMANDVFNYASENNIDEQHMVQLYYPLLNKKNILNKSSFEEVRQNLIEDNKKILKPQSQKIQNIVDSFYNTYYSRKNELRYIDRGINHFDIILHPYYNVPLPLEIIFKQIHSTKTIPYIKYNPGPRQESVYRFYSENISKNGKKIPYLLKNHITLLSKKTGKSKQISLYIQHATLKQDVELFMDFDYNGNIRIKSELSRPISINDLETIIYNAINPVINDVNLFLEKSGYKIPMFNKLNDENIEIIDLRYECSINIDKRFSLNKYIGCLTSIFEVANIDMDVTKGVDLRFIRVENYKKMDAMSIMITEVFNRTNDRKEVINSLMINFMLSEEDAFLKLVKYFDDHTFINGQYANKKMDLIDNPGFPIFIYKSLFDNKMKIKVDKINSVDFINILHVYFDSIIRLITDSENIDEDLLKNINKLCSKMEKKEEEVVDNLISTSENIFQPISIEEEDEDDKYLPEDEEEEDDKFLPDEEDDDKFLPGDEEETTGGAKSSLSKSKDEIFYKKSNIFTKRLKEREPSLILTQKQGKYKAYSRACPSNVSRQPVILTDEEKQKIDDEHPGSYTNAFKYGTDKNNPYWYICPRYWCLKTNNPMTEDEVNRGECGGKIIPDNSKPPPPNHFIYEFTDEKYHKDENGKYVYHSPGFLPEDSHPDFCLPCCMSRWSAYSNKNPSTQQTRRNQCGLTDNYVLSDDVDTVSGKNNPKIGPDGKPMQYADYEEEDKPVENLQKDDKEKQKRKANVFGVDRSPLPQYRWGFLPLSVELFLHTDNNKFVTKNNAALIKQRERPLLRYGVEQSQHQSFIGVIADIYSHYKNEALLSIQNMRKKMMELITLDDYLKLHNGSLVSIFKPKKYIDDVSVENYSNTEFYKSINLSIPAQYDFLKDTISSFENFLEYLNDNDSLIDHTYLWDVITSKESVLFNGGLNLVIMEITDNDITDNIEILCPNDSYSANIYDKNRGTILLLKHNDFYEPIYLYGDKDKANPIPPIKIFTNNTTTKELKEVKKIFDMIINSSNKYCKANAARPRVYSFKENILAESLYQKLNEIELVIDSQVLNYKGKVIGFMVSSRKEDDKYVLVPCFPSTKVAKLKQIFMDEIQWQPYVKTRDTLSQIHNKSKGAIRCKPLMKVVEDGLIVGLLTETNQFLLADPPMENIVEDGLATFAGKSYKDYVDIDKSVSISKKQDELRVKTIQNISLETQFYTSFRNIVRNLLNDYTYREIRREIVGLLDDSQYLYNVKMKKLEILLRHLTKNSVRFIDTIDDSVKDKLATCTTNCNTESFCLMEDNKICIPKKHLVSGNDNNALYYSRISDELLRYKRIRLFMLEPKKYLNITNVEYLINDDELLLLNSILFGDYFEDLEPMQNNKYAQNITYDIANPSRNTNFYQHYSDDVTLNNQEYDNE
jgi:hypothetical protein